MVSDMAVCSHCWTSLVLTKWVRGEKTETDYVSLWQKLWRSHAIRWWSEMYKQYLFFTG